MTATALPLLIAVAQSISSTAPSSSQPPVPSTQPATTSTQPMAPSTQPVVQAARPVVQPSLPSAAPWTDARIDASAVADQLECFDFAYTRQSFRGPDGSSTQRDVLVFQARATRTTTLAVLQARMLDETGMEVDRAVVRFKPIVLHWMKDQSATASCWIDPEVMPRVRRIELLPL